MKHKSIKIDRYRYRVPIPKRRMQISVDLKMSVVEHKGRFIIAYTRGFENIFNSCDTINRSEAIKMIGFLSDYVNLVKATKATALNASIRKSSRSIETYANHLTGLKLNNKEKK